MKTGGDRNIGGKGDANRGSQMMFVATKIFKTSLS